MTGRRAHSARGSDIPETVLRSEKGAQRVWLNAHARAVRRYGEGRRAHEAAYDALRRSYTRTEEGDRWIRHPERRPARGVTMELRSLDEPLGPYHRRAKGQVCE
jgi:hypothetical protein